MARLRPTWQQMQFQIDRSNRLEEMVKAWNSRYWEVLTHGRHIPSDEDRVKYDGLIGNSSKELIEQWKDQPDLL